MVARKNYTINFIDYEKIMELDGRPYQILLNPISLSQLEEGYSRKMRSYIGDEKRRRYLEYYLSRELEYHDDFKLIKDREEVYIAIRFIGGELPDDLSYLSEDHDIEIYFIKLLDENI